MGSGYGKTCVHCDLSVAGPRVQRGATMSGAVDKLDLGGSLAERGAQVSRVKSQKTSKLNFLAKAARIFEDDPTNLVIWR